MRRAKFLLYVFLFVPGLTSAQFLFKDVSVPAGIYMRSTTASAVGPGVVIFDFNNDGWDDIYMPGCLDSDKIFINMHDGTFKDVTPAEFAVHGTSPQSFRTNPRGGIAFDYDNDGLTDLYCVCENHDILWHNNGDGTFTDVSKQAGLISTLDKNESTSATFGDFNGDGFNDFYVARWVDEFKWSISPDSNTRPKYANKGFPDWFYVNNGDGTFTDRSNELNVGNDTGCGNIALFFDYDRDGDLDLIVGNDYGVDEMPNRIYKNMLMETGKAYFVRVDSAIDLDSRLFCMGIGANDYNRDGNFDFFETTTGPNLFMKNKGDGKFVDVSKTVLPPTNGYERNGTFLSTSWTALMGDFDNDGWEDGFIVHGYVGIPPPWTTNPDLLDTSVFLHNIGSFFEDYTDQAMNGNYLDFRGRGGAYLDFNHDGKLDICIASHGVNPYAPLPDYRLLENITLPKNTGHWLEMRFTAKRTAKEAIGTIVDVWAGGIIHTRQVSTGGGFGSQNSLMQHVGLGDLTKIDSLNVFWPADKHRHRQIDHYYNLPVDTLLYFIEQTGGESVVSAPAADPLRVYPSPARDHLNVQNLQPVVTKRFEIYDLLGIRHVDVTGTESAFSLSVGNLKPGCYVLRITAEGNAVTKQFIKE